MEKASMLLINVKRDMEHSFISLLKQNNVSPAFTFPCQGTAGKTVLALLGLEMTERTMVLAVTTRARAIKAMHEMVSTLGINLPGYGIAMNIPLGSVGGVRSVNYLMGEMKIDNGEANKAEETREFPYDLIIAIAHADTSDQVMAAAKTAGAGGGTIVHAKGTGEENAMNFLGVKFVAEKELVLIVVRHEKKNDVMRAIMNNAGIRSEAHSVVFSVPVESVEGLRSLMTPENAPKTDVKP